MILFAVGEAEGDSMRPKERREIGQSDLFKARLDQILDMSHALAKLARASAPSIMMGQATAAADQA